MRIKRSSFLLTLPMLAFALGCPASSDPNRRETAEVTVKLTMDGQPLPDAMVTFVMPQDPVPAAGKTDANGVAKLTTYETDDGAVLGSHNIMILKTEITGKEAADQDSAAYDPNAPTTQKIKSLIPEKYNNPGKSGFTADVKQGKNEFTFDLKSK